MILVLEDNDDKLINLMDDHPEIFSSQQIFICRSKEQADRVMQNYGYTATLVLDDELDPGMGSGSDFLSSVLPENKYRIDKVYLTTLSSVAQKKMCELCDFHDVARQILE